MKASAITINEALSTFRDERLEIGRTFAEAEDPNAVQLRLTRAEIEARYPVYAAQSLDDRANVARDMQAAWRTYLEDTRVISDIYAMRAAASRLVFEEAIA
jgi:hypothetical protein